MPEGTRVHRCVEKVKRKGGNVNPYAVCQASTHQSFATGKSRTKEGKRVGETFRDKLDDALTIVEYGMMAADLERIVRQMLARLPHRPDAYDLRMYLKRFGHDPRNPDIWSQAVDILQRLSGITIESRRQLTEADNSLLRTLARVVKANASRHPFFAKIVADPNEFTEFLMSAHYVLKDMPPEQHEMIASGPEGVKILLRRMVQDYLRRSPEIGDPNQP